jgi:hypothetical protein
MKRSLALVIASSLRGVCDDAAGRAVQCCAVLLTSISSGVTIFAPPVLPMATTPALHDARSRTSLTLGGIAGLLGDESLERCTYSGSGVATPLRGPMVHVERFKLFAPWAAARKHSLPGTGWLAARG